MFGYEKEIWGNDLLVTNESLEAKNLNNPSRQHPGDIFIPEFDTYGDAYLSVKSYLLISSKELLCGANVRYLEKMKKYPDLGPKFKPLVIESTGGWHNYSMDYLKSIAGHIASRSNKSNISVLNNLLSVHMLLCITKEPSHHASSTVPETLLNFITLLSSLL
jgi:hypothetical protein